jgi:hypothetical protein
MFIGEELLLFGFEFEEGFFLAVVGGETLQDFHFGLLEVLVDLVFEEDVVVEVALSFGARVAAGFC